MKAQFFFHSFAIKEFSLNKYKNSIQLWRNINYKFLMNKFEEYVTGNS
jgi:hypothetical protein